MNLCEQQLQQKHVTPNIFYSNESYTPTVIWLTGLSAAGKTTIAHRLKERLTRISHIPTRILDGDEIRTGLCSDLGFSERDRNENIRRIAEVAKIFLETGFITIVACISPLEESRKKARDLYSKGQFIEVFVDTPINICEQRDPKKLYKKARSASLKQFTGISAKYQTPTAPDIHLLNGQQPVEASVEQLIQYLITEERISARLL